MMPRTSYDHPFGREHEVSIQHLFGSFCNHLHLGQWELAAACVHDLHTEGKEFAGVDIQKVLEEIARNPYGVCIGSNSVQSPHHLAWLCYLGLTQITDGSIDQDALRRELEFGLLLCEACLSISADILEELYKYHQASSSCSKDELRKSGAAQLVSSEAQDFLFTLLQEEPALGHALVGSLTFPIPACAQNNELLQKIHLKCLSSLLHRLGGIHNPAITTPPGQTELDYREDREEQIKVIAVREKFVQLLALFNPRPENRSVLPLLNEFLIMLVKFTHSDKVPPDLLPLNVVYSTLVGHPSAFLLEKFCELDLRLRKDAYRSQVEALGADLPDAEPAGLLDTEECVLGTAMKPDRSVAWRDLYLLSLKQEKHFLDIIMETSVHLIQCSRLDLLGQLLKPVEFQPLRPLVLLVGWDHCVDTATAEKLLSVLHIRDMVTGSSTHPKMAEACNRLSYQLQLTQWCLKKMTSLDVPVVRGDPSRRLFQSLEVQSALRILHTAIANISHLEPELVLDFIRDKPKMLTSRESCQKSSQKKSVTFAVSDSSVSSQSAQLSCDQARDVTVYRSYCAVKDVMEAVAFCSECESWEGLVLKTRTSSLSDSAGLLVRTERCQSGGSAASTHHYSRQGSALSSSSSSSQVWLDDNSVRKESLASSASHRVQPAPDGATLKESYRDGYQANVVQRLESAKVHLCEIQPLNYRLEVLEDLYSLLFVTHEDIQVSDTSSAQWDSGEEGAGNSRDDSLDCFLDPVGAYSGLKKTLTPLSPRSPEIASPKLASTAKPSEKIQVLHKRVNTSLVRELSYMSDDAVVKGAAGGCPDAAPGFQKMYSSGAEVRNLKSSGEMSGYSTTSTASASRVGFLVNEFIARDLLLLLKESLVNLNAARYSVIAEPPPPGLDRPKNRTNQGDPDHLGEHLPCAISLSQLPQRISQLTQYVSEGLWRFQLVAHDWVPREFGVLPKDDECTIHDGSSDEELDLLEDFGDEESTRRKPSRRKSDGTPSCTESESHWTTDSAASTGPHGKRRRNRKKSRKGRRSRRGHGSRYRGFIPRLLASKETLLTMCLRQKKYTQAGQVVKMFNLEESALAQEVSFAEHFQAAVRKLQLQDGRSTSSSHAGLPSRPLIGMGKPSMAAIARVAASGVASLSVTGVIDQVLSVASLPNFPEDSVLAIQEHGPSIFKSFLEADNVPAMIILDLACVACKTWDSSVSLLDIVQKRLPAGSACRSVTSMTQPLQNLSLESQTLATGSVGSSLPPASGNFGFVQLLDQLSDTLKHGSLEGLGDSLYPAYRCSITHCLSSASLPLDLGRRKLVGNALLHIDRDLKKASKAIRDVVLHPSHAAQPRSQYRGKKRDTFRVQKPLITMATKHLIDTLQKYLPKGGLLRTLLRVKEESLAPDYLQCLHSHLQVLAELHSQWSTRREAGEMERYLLLTESPTETIGQLIFEQNTPPSTLEEVAGKLHVDLVSVISSSCCPSISAVSPEHSTPDTTIVILNEDSSRLQTKSLVKDPERLVREMLTKLVKLMKDFAVGHHRKEVFTAEAARALLQSGRHQGALEKTALLSQVDLASLASNREKQLCFYANLASLMTVHMLLYEAQKNAEKASVGAELLPLLPGSCEELVLLYKQRAYNVGQLGTVSYFDLVYTIMRKDLPPPRSHQGLIAASAFGLDPDDPWNTLGCPSEPRLLFVLGQGHVSSPPLQVLCPALLQDQLEVATQFYLNTTVHVHTQTAKVYLPSLLRWHKGDFPARTTGDPDLTENTQLLMYITAKLEAATRDTLDELLQQQTEAKSNKMKQPSVRVITNAYNYEVALTFHYQTWQTLQSPNPTKNRHSWPCDGKAMGSPVPQILREPEKYCLTSDTLAYLKSCSEFVAMVTSLVCQDSIQSQMLSDYFHSSASVAAEGSEALAPELKENEITEFRHKKVMIEHSILKRFLETCVVPFVPDGPQNCRLEDIGKFYGTLDRGFRAAILAGPNSAVYQQAMVEKIVSMAIAQHRWIDLVELLAKLPEACFRGFPGASTTRDFVLCCAANCTDADSGWKYLLRLCNATTKQRVILGSLPRWPVAVCIKLLNACPRAGPETGREAAGASSTGHLDHLVSIRLQQMLLYERVTGFAKEMQTKVSSTQPHGGQPESTANELLQKLSQWQGLVELSHNAPEEVMEVLLQSGDFDLIGKWTQAFDFPQPLQQKVEQHHVAYLLEKEHPEPVRAFQLLEGLQSADAERCYGVCSGLLSALGDKANTLFVVDFMLSQLRGSLGARRVQELTLLCIGCKALLCLREPDRASYEHLVSAPLLLLEQLLMNMKMEWAGKVLTCVRAQLLLAVKTGVSLTVDMSDCDSMLERYARLAVEFPVPEVPTPGSLSRSQSKMSLASAYPSMQQGHRPIPRRVSTVVGMATTAPGPMVTVHMSESAGLLPLVGRRASDAAPGSLPAASVLMDANRLSTTPSSPADVASSSRVFVIPAEPPPKDKWVPDSAAEVCMVCTVQRFSMFNRRHHCRRCGRVVCGTCSSRTTEIGGLSARTCDQCYRQIYPSKSTSLEHDRLHLLREQLSGISSNSESPGGRAGSHSPGIQITVGSAGSDQQEPALGAATGMAQACSEYQYHLSQDEDLNELTRREFYYDYAPSVSLCLSIIELHSDARRCGRVLLELCDIVSKQLQPLPTGLRNPEVDYGLVLSMLKYLLYNAKMKFVKVNDNAGVTQSEMFQDLVHLLDLLVSCGSTSVPSIQQLTKMDTLRRLRDLLIEEEKLSTAMEVSTKGGLDPSGVWVAWGKACLQAGDLPGARDKFIKCLKAPVDKHLAPPSMKLLKDVLKCLETAPLSVGNNAEAVLAPLKSIKDLLAEPQMRAQGDLPMDDPRMQESLHYLRIYGNHAMMINFHREHGQMSQALHYVLDKKCNAEVFVDALLVPCLTSGHVTQLQDQLVAVDPSLERWAPQLNAACRYLNRSRLMDSLYQLQLFMKDYIRAAMTCITHFYQHGARDYVSLQERMAYLQQARRHLEAYLGERQWGRLTMAGSRTSAGGDAPMRLLMTPAEVTKYTQTVNLQIEVTKHLNQYHDIYESVSKVTSTEASLAKPGGSPRTVAAATRAIPGAESRSQKGTTSSSQPSVLPTLFGSTRMRTDVAALVLLCGNNLHDGFGLAFRIIREFKLDSTSVYSQVACQLARQARLSAIKQLVECIKDSGISMDSSLDEVILASIKVIAQDAVLSKDAELLIKMVRNDANKVNAYIECGRLRSAYLVAVQARRIEDVKRIRDTAERLGQPAVVSISDKWLQKHAQQR